MAVSHLDPAQVRTPVIHKAGTPMNTWQYYVHNYLAWATGRITQEKFMDPDKEDAWQNAAQYTCEQAKREADGTLKMQCHIQNEEHFFAWFCTVFQARLNDIYRSRNRNCRLKLSTDIGDALPEKETPSTATDQQSEILHEAIKSLPNAEDQEIINEHIQGVALTEIARKHNLGTTSNYHAETARRRIKRIQDQLKAWLVENTKWDPSLEDFLE
jgi:DNA-directed RNA polymerase specialized sigma24 family protein